MTAKSPSSIKLLDVVALLTAIPARDLYVGQVGTVVEQLSPDYFEVEFSDDSGRSYAQVALHRDQILPLHFHKLPEVLR